MTTKIRHKTVFWALFLAMAPSAEGLGPADHDIGSGVAPFNLIESASAADNTGKAAKAAGGMASDVKTLADPEIGGTKVNWWSEIKKGAASFLVPYNNSKATVIQMVDGALKKTNDVISKAADRVDMWRRTKEDLENYYEAAERVLNDTKELFHDFKWERLFDVERKWDRSREQLFDADVDGSHWRGRYVNLYNSFSSYMLQKYDAANVKKTEKALMPSLDHKAYGSFLEPADENDTLATLINVAGGGNWKFIAEKFEDLEGTLVSYRTVRFATASLVALNHLELEYAGEDTAATRKGECNKCTISEAALVKISTKLGESKQTEYDTEELSAEIAAERSNVRIQMLRATQIHTQLEVYYNNLFLREKMASDHEAAVIEQSLQVLIAGVDVYNQYYDEYVPYLDVKPEPESGGR